MPRRKIRIIQKPFRIRSLKESQIVRNVLKSAKEKHIKVNSLGQMLADLGYTRKEAKNVAAIFFWEQGIKDPKNIERQADYLVTSYYDSRIKQKKR